MIRSFTKLFRAEVWVLVLTATFLYAEQPHTLSKGWVIPQRYLPVPSAVSPQLKEILSQLSQPDIERVKREIPKGKREWLEMAEGQTDMMTDYIKLYARDMSVNIRQGNIGGVKVYRVTPVDISKEHRGHLFCYLHGGAYIFGSGDAGLPEAVMIAHRIKIPVLSIDYRTAPQNPFPAAVDDVAAVYKTLLKTHSADTIAIGGSSSGGGLALASIHKFKSLGLILPAAIYAGTPWSDLTKTGDSYYINEGVDHKLITYDGFIEAAAKLYANGSDLKNPLLSPVYGDFKGFPPVYLVTGTRDLFLSNTIRVHRKLRKAGVDADLNVYEGFSHVEYLVAKDSPEAKEMYRELGVFLSKHLSSGNREQKITGQ